MFTLTKRPKTHDTFPSKLQLDKKKFHEITYLEKKTWQIKQKWFTENAILHLGKSEEAESVISFTKDALNVNMNNF